MNETNYNYLNYDYQIDKWCVDSLQSNSQELTQSICDSGSLMHNYVTDTLSDLSIDHQFDALELVDWATRSKLDTQ